MPVIVAASSRHAAGEEESMSIGLQTPGVFNPFRVGLDHLALACAQEQELERVAAALARADVPSTGVKTDEVLGKR
jgi:hypothetical protein